MERRSVRWLKLAGSAGFISYKSKKERGNDSDGYVALLVRLRAAVEYMVISGRHSALQNPNSNSTFESLASDPSEKVLQPRAKQANYSNRCRPALTRFRLPAIRNNIV